MGRSPGPGQRHDLSGARRLVDRPGDQEHAFGDSLSAVDVERPQIKVIVRGKKNGAGAARQKAHDVWKKLRRLADVTLSGTRWINVEAESPQWLGLDENELPRWHFDLSVEKEESA